MLRIATLAMTSAALLGFGLAPAAEAKTNFNIDIGFGVAANAGTIYIGQPAYDDDDYYLAEDDCVYVKVKRKKWNAAHTHKITYYTKELVCE